MVLSGAVRERRDFVRIDSNFPVQLQYMKPDESMQFYNSISQDFSEGGIQISSFYFYPVHSKMMVDLYLDVNFAPIKTVGKVVWVKQLAYQDVFKVGIEFSDLSVSNQYCLRELISNKID